MSLLSYLTIQHLRIPVLSLSCLLFASALLCGCASQSPLEGTVVASRAIDKGLIEHLVQTSQEGFPYFKIRTNTSTLLPGSRVRIELP